MADILPQVVNRCTYYYPSDSFITTHIVTSLMEHLRSAGRHLSLNIMNRTFVTIMLKYIEPLGTVCDIVKLIFFINLLFQRVIDTVPM